MNCVLCDGTGTAGDQYGVYPCSCINADKDSKYTCANCQDSGIAGDQYGVYECGCNINKHVSI